MPPNAVEDDPRTWRALLICPSDAMRDAVQSALDRTQLRETVSLREYPGLWEIASVTTGYQICLLDGSSDTSFALQLLKRITGANISVVVLHPCPDDNLILECLRRGAAQVMACSEEEVPLQSALGHVAARRYYSSRPMCVPGAVYGVMAGKGGSGGTTTSTQLAIRLAEARPRKTLLIDLDGIAAGVALLLQQTPTHSVLDVAAHRSRLDEDLFKRTVLAVGPLDVLLAPVQSTAFEISADNCSQLVEFCRSLYDCVILDLPSCYSESSLAFARSADILLIVSSCELSAVHSTLRTIAYLEHSGVPPNRIKLVLNRYRRGETLLDSRSAPLREKVFAHLSEAGKELQSWLLHGVSIPPSSAYACDIAALAHKLTGWQFALSQERRKKLGLRHFLKELWRRRNDPKRDTEAMHALSGVGT